MSTVFDREGVHIRETSTVRRKAQEKVSTFDKVVGQLLLQIPARHPEQYG